MTTLLAVGSPTTNLTESDVARLTRDALATLGDKHRVLAIPPDFTRANSRAGIITDAVAAHYGSALTDVLPALGTHVPMSDAHIARMYPGTPRDRFRNHDWRNEVETIGILPAEFVKAATGGVYDKPWPAQLNRLVWNGGHDLILSIGQVVPHEVVGIANHTKNLFVGCGGKAGIDESHFIGACYGMERMMGRADTPVRRILNEALLRFCGHLPIVFVLTVVGKPAPGERADGDGLVTRGLFIGSGTECFELAAKLSVQVNFIQLDEEPRKMVVHLDPEEFHTTWLGNKAIYRTRMAIATGGDLIVLAPGLTHFGEDPGIDRLIRTYGYRTTPEIMAAVRDNADLQGSLSAAAHLIHGSPEGRFRVTYCTPSAPGSLTPAEIRSVGYEWADLGEMQRRYDPKRLTDGWNDIDGERNYYISNPALGLWAWKGRLGA
jgi:nickel-dependent lactate racemase